MIRQHKHRLVSETPKEFERESGVFLTPRLMLWGGSHIAHQYGCELLYLRVWHDHSVQSAHILVYMRA